MVNKLILVNQNIPLERTNVSTRASGLHQGCDGVDLDFRSLPEVDSRQGMLLMVLSHVCDSFVLTPPLRLRAVERRLFGPHPNCFLDASLKPALLALKPALLAIQIWTSFRSNWCPLAEGVGRTTFSQPQRCS